MIVREGGIRTCLVLQRIEPLLSLCNLGDVVPHNVHSVVDLSLDGGRLRIPSTAGRVGRGAAAGEVGVIRLGPSAFDNNTASRTGRRKYDGGDVRKQMWGREGQCVRAAQRNRG